MVKKKHYKLLLSSVLFLLVLIFNTLNQPATPGQVASETTERTQVKVIKVVDGDTIKLETGETVRYIGIDTPETVDPRRPAMCFGKEASVKNKEIVEGKMVELEKDVSETDKYGRLLRYVWIDGLLINEFLVREGYAHASAYPPDVKYQERFTKAQQIAREEQRGLWNSCQKIL